MYDVVCCLVVWNNLVLIQIDSPVHFPLERKLESKMLQRVANCSLNL
jgi:hypothetical protein